MCGINVVFDPSHGLPGKSALVSHMNNQMVYRGPDDQGVYADDWVALGMRRLSIIDVTGGNQPLYNEDRSLVLICNGEIYNHVELRRELDARGHRFMSASDAEVILHLYEEKGEHCLESLRGMFAFALWDVRRKRLFAARDRVGIKPLYLAEIGGALWLSSELKAILGAAGISPTLRPVAVYQFLLYGYAIDQRHTVVEEVKRILPGEYLLADASGIRLARYWVPRFGGDAGITDRSDDDILSVLEDAVELHLRSDVPVGVLLSGGIDSSALAAFAARSGGDYLALCAGYSGRHGVDERGQAHATASFLGMKHEDVILDPAEYEDSFDQLLDCGDEPIGDVAAMPQWSLYKQARQLGLKVLLSGIGGDEVFFGYPKWNDAGDRCRNLSPLEFKNWVGFDLDGWYVDNKMLLERVSGEPLKAAAEGANTPLREMRDWAPQGPDAMNAMLFGSYLVHNGCQLADKLGMGCSVEVRVPLLDHELVQSVFDLPLHRRFESGRSKVMLKRILHGLVPDAVLDAEKRGFTPPHLFVDNLVTNRIGQVMDGILVKDGWFDRKELYRICSQHAVLPWLRVRRVRNLMGIPKATSFLFRMLAFESWFLKLKTNRSVMLIK